MSNQAADKTQTGSDWIGLTKPGSDWTGLTKPGLGQILLKKLIFHISSLDQDDEDRSRK